MIRASTAGQRQRPVSYVVWLSYVLVACCHSHVACCTLSVVCRTSYVCVACSVLHALLSDACCLSHVTYAVICESRGITGPRRPLRSAAHSFGKSGLLKTKLGISAGSKELAAAQSTYGAQLSDKGIDLSADAEMLKEGDKAIQQVHRSAYLPTCLPLPVQSLMTPLFRLRRARWLIRALIMRSQAQDASALNTQQLVKKLQVTRSKSHVQLKTRRAPTTELSAAAPIETRLAQTSTVVAVAPDGPAHPSARPVAFSLLRLHWDLRTQG